MAAQEENDVATEEQEKPEVKVAQEHCWVDESPELCEVEYAGVLFKMRALSAGDQQEMYAQLRMAVKPEDVTDKKAVEAYAAKLASRIDIFELQILTIAHALGVFKNLCGEGWFIPPSGVLVPNCETPTARLVTIENVRLMGQKLHTLLTNKHCEFFRTSPSDPNESGQDD